MIASLITSLCFGTGVLNCETQVKRCLAGMESDLRHCETHASDTPKRCGNSVDAIRYLPLRDKVAMCAPVSKGDKSYFWGGR